MPTPNTPYRIYIQCTTSASTTKQAAIRTISVLEAFLKGGNQDILKESDINVTVVSLRNITEITKDG